jgi:selenocysteine-specific elongation factor
MRVIGTAGHVDHGKSTLIEAITGFHPDRLREEREREMTIVLGFAWVTLPNGEEIGIVDVPGHRDFIENMLSGIGAIDSALFVVAADEGVMPQTREHLAILDLLQIQGGIVALTKIDLVDDSEWLSLVESDLQETLSGTVLESAPIVRVSAKTGEGIPILLEKLGNIMSDKPPRPNLFRPRMAVDRAFTMPGFGTIVTGTLIDGHFQVGEEISIMPHKLNGRIRGLQTHKRKVEIAYPGSRTAINITGVNVAQIQRGDVVIYPDQYQSTRRLDVSFRLLPDVSQPLRHNTDVKLFISASEVNARVRLLGSDSIKPGNGGWLQLELSNPVVCVRGDRYIIRRPSPGETLGGGIVLDSSPRGRHKRHNKKVIERLETLIDGSPEDILLQTSLSFGLASKKDILIGSNLDHENAELAFNSLLNSQKIMVLNENSDAMDSNALIASAEYWQHLTKKASDEIDAYHNSFPLRPGIPREELKSRLNISSKIFNAAVDRWVNAGLFDEPAIMPRRAKSSVPVISSANFMVIFTEDQKKLMDKLLDRFANNPFSPPTIKETIEFVGIELFNAMVNSGTLIQLSDEIVFRQEDYEKILQNIQLMFKNQDTITVAQVRDTFDTSRRYALSILEYFDKIGLTVRVGDVRKSSTRVE